MGTRRGGFNVYQQSLFWAKMRNIYMKKKKKSLFWAKMRNIYMKKKKKKKKKKKLFFTTNEKSV